MADTRFTLYVARHGETEYNRQRLMQGQQVDAELNQRGRIQAGALCERFKSIPISTLYSSPLRRAWETASTVGAPQGISPVRMDTVSEMSWGDLEGRPIDSVQPYLQDLTLQWRSGKFGHAVGGGETILEVQERAQAALDAITVSATEGDVVLLVTHGRFLRVLLATALPAYGLTRMEAFKHSNTGVYRLDHGLSGFEIGLSNCTEHLSPTGAEA